MFTASGSLLWDGTKEVGSLTVQEDADTIRKVLTNKAVTDPTTSKYTIYDDDDTTVLLEGTIFEDANGTAPYVGQGSERRERLT